MTLEQLSLPNLQAPREGVYSCGQPSVEQLRALGEQGVRAVVTLRPAAEHDLDERAAVEGFGMRFFEIPVAGPGDVNEENARRLSDIIEDPANRPILIHCGSGNRVGALYALKAFHCDGQELEQAIELGRCAGLQQLEPVVRNCLTNAAPRR